MNFLAGRAGASSAGGISCELEGLGQVALPLQSDDWKPNEPVTVGIRPEHIELEDTGSCTAVKGVVNIVENLGGETYLHVEIAPGAPLLMVKLHGSHGPARRHVTSTCRRTASTGRMNDDADHLTGSKSVNQLPVSAVGRALLFEPFSRHDAPAVRPRTNWRETIMLERSLKRDQFRS
jgi:hypothetical protein